MRQFAIVTFVLVGGLCAGVKAKADVCDTPTNLVANCGFETGDLTSWTGTPTSQAGNWYGVDNFDAYTGNFGAYIAGFGSFSLLADTAIDSDHYWTRVHLQLLRSAQYFSRSHCYAG